MKRLLFTLIAAFTLAGAGYAQEFPYSKLLKYTDKEFNQERFKYDAKKNTWTLTKNHGLQATLNVLSAVTGADADIRPDTRDYAITVHMSDNDLIAYIDVVFFDDNTYHKLMTFAKDNGQNILETDSNNVRLCQFNYSTYSLSLRMQQVKLTATTSRTNTALVKSYDESYNRYHFVINTGVEPTSAYLSKQAAKKAKREAKGKKHSSVEDLM